MSKTSLIFGDCLEKMKFIPDRSVDMVLCDLPYGTTQNKWDSIIPLGSLWQAYCRVIKEDGAIVLFAQTPFDKLLGASNLELLKYEWIWKKTRATGHLNANRAPMKEHENILVFYKKLPVYLPQGLVKKSVATVRKGRKGNGTNYGKSDRDAIQEFTNYPKTIIEAASESGHHPTQKPTALLEYLIKTYTNEGMTVLDNTMGSGSTGVACVNTGRNFIGIEKDPTYFEIATKRIEEARNVRREEERRRETENGPNLIPRNV